MITRLLKIGLAALAVSAGMSASAQDEEAAAEQLYQVEVLVFRHLDQARNTPEIPRLVEPEIEDVLDQQLARLAAEPATLPATNDLLSGLPGMEAVPIWTRVDPAQGYLQADAARLRRLDAYEVLAHLAWVQAAEDVSVAEQIDVTSLGSSGFEGFVKLYRKRYLHLALDLELGSPSAGGANLFGTSEAPPGIVDSRRMRPGRTVYFDQPRFGVLATVNKIDRKIDRRDAG